MLWLLIVFHIIAPVKSGSHSLSTYATLILGETPFPEFSAVLMLDSDIQVGYYDSEVKKFVFRGDKVLEQSIDADDHGDAIKIYEDMYKIMKMRARYYKQHYNLTNGIHVEQRQLGCELLEDDIPGKMMTKIAFDGVKGNEMHFNIHLRTFQSGFQCTWPGSPDTKTLQEIYAYFYHPICIRALRKCLNVGKKYLLNKVKPSISLFQRTLPDSGGAILTCLATGFYPVHINLNLHRNTLLVSDHQITEGELLPNGDGTYQMRKSLELSAEELKNIYSYTCTVDHCSLDNSLVIGLAIGSDGYMEYYVTVILVSIFVFGIIIALACVKMKWQGSISTKHFQSVQGKYTAPGIEENSSDAIS